MKVFTENETDKLLIEGREIVTHTTISFTVRNNFKHVRILIKKQNVTIYDMLLIMAWLFDRDPTPTKGECFPTFQ